MTKTRWIYCLSNGIRQDYVILPTEQYTNHCQRVVGGGVVWV